MISITTMLLIPLLPSIFCGVMSVGKRAVGWLALSWVLTLAIYVTIIFVYILNHVPLDSVPSENSYIMAGKAIGAAIAMSMYWIVTGVVAFFVARRIRMGRNVGDKK